MPPPRRADPITLVIARHVRAIRRRREWTTERLAAELARVGLTEFDRSAVTRFEVGGRKAVPVPVWLAFARALDVSPLDLIAPEDGEPVPIVPGSPPVPAAAAREWIITGGPDRVRSGTAAARGAVGGAKVVESIEDRLAALERANIERGGRT